MKHFTQREQIIIHRIIEDAVSDTYVLTNAFNVVLNGRGVAFDTQKGFLQFEKSKYNNVSSILQVEREFIETALLIQHLISNQYIYPIIDSQEPPLPWIGDQLKNPTGKQIPRDIADIFNNSFVRIVVLNKLRDLVSDGFITYEEQQLTIAQGQLNIAAGSLNEAHFQSDNAKITTRISIITCAVAVLTLLATLLIPCCSSCSCNKEYGIEHPEEYAVELDIKVVNSQLEKTNAYLLQLIEQTNNLTNNFSIKPKVQINTRRKSISKKKESLTTQPVLKIDTITCDGETYWILPCPPQNISNNK